MSQNFLPENYFPASVGPVKRPTGSGSLLQWFNALPYSNGRGIATGWHIQASRCSEELTKALKDFGYEQISIFHRSTNNNEEYWKIEQCSLFVLCNGFEDSWTMRNTDARYGIAFGWQNGKGATKLKCKAIISELAIMGYYEPLSIPMEGWMTEEFLKALSEQLAVLDAFHALTGIDAPFYGFSLEIAPAAKNKMVGKGKDKSPIIPTIAVITALDAEYFTAHLAPPEVLRYIVENDLLKKTVQWSVDTSHRISLGEDRETWETEEYDASLRGKPPRTPRPAEQPVQGEAAAPDAADTMPATDQQINAIRKLCSHIGRQVPNHEPATYREAKALIATLSAEYREMRSHR